MQEIKTGFGIPFLVVWPYILPQEERLFSPRPQIFSSIFPRDIYFSVLSWQICDGQLHSETYSLHSEIPHSA